MGIDKNFTRSGVQGGPTPGLLLMAPSDATTSHLSWCKSPWVYRTITAPGIRTVPMRRRGGRHRRRNCSLWRLPCSAPVSSQVQGWRMGWGLAAQSSPGELSVQLQAKGRQAPFLGMSLCSSVQLQTHNTSQEPEPVCLVSRMHQTLGGKEWLRLALENEVSGVDGCSRSR